MPRPQTTVPAIYGDVRHAEIAPLARTYYQRFKADPNELAPFTAYDATVDTNWLKQFETSIKATERIKPAIQVRKEGAAITKQINELSKTSVRLGKELIYWLKQAYQTDPATDLPTLLDSFPIVAANDAMRLGDTEAMLLHLGAIQLALAPHLGKLTTAGYPSPTAYADLATQISDLNTRQTNHLLAIPDGTDQAQRLRNDTYTYVRRLLDLNDILPDRTATKRAEYRVVNALKKMRAALPKPAPKPRKPKTPPPPAV